MIETVSIAIAVIFAVAVGLVVCGFGYGVILDIRASDSGNGDKEPES